MTPSPNPEPGSEEKRMETFCDWCDHAKSLHEFSRHDDMGFCDASGCPCTDFAEAIPPLFKYRG